MREDKACTNSEEGRGVRSRVERLREARVDQSELTAVKTEMSWILDTVTAEMLILVRQARLSRRSWEETCSSPAGRFGKAPVRLAPVRSISSKENNQPLSSKVINCTSMESDQMMAVRRADICVSVRLVLARSRLVTLSQGRQRRPGVKLERSWPERQRLCSRDSGSCTRMWLS